MDSRLRTLNTAWLLAIILNPFATKLLTIRGHQSLDVNALLWGFYALVQCLNSVTLLAMSRHMIRRSQVAGMPTSVVTSTTWESAGLVIGFGVSIPVFFLTTYGWVLWFAGPLAIGQVHRLRSRRSTPKTA